MIMKTFSYKDLAAAYVRGEGQRQDIGLPEELTALPLEELSEDQKDELIALGKTAELKMHYFKEKDQLPRVQLVIGFLRGMVASGQIASVLDVGSGRGAFLFPLLTEFPRLEVTSIDILPHRVALLQSVERGGVDNLHAMEGNLCEWDGPEGAFDAVTLLEVLEHIPDVEKAAANAVRMARRFVIVTVPSKPDDNPEHIHLFTKDMLSDMFLKVGCSKVKFDSVLNHLFMIAIK
jgi:2-polyprenyl-3-methyl-5-hydroxy-6-metoxy-1,4-benzoquinol methylase